MRLPGALAIIMIVLVGCAPKQTSAPPDAVDNGDSGLVLSRADVPGAGWRTVAVPDRLGWSFALTDCAAYEAGDYTAQEHRTSAHGASYTQGHDRSVLILLEVYAESWSTQALTDIREVIEACPRYQSEQALTSHTIESEGFAGDEALLIRSDVIRGAVPAVEWWTAVVRKGASVATVTGTNMTATEVRRIALTQARRL
jgi:hypothetical protein